MRLKELTVKNFKNFENEHTIKLTDLNLFSGDNGAGKSALILDSILFALYGYTDATLDSLVSIGKKKAEVQLFLEYQNKTYSIKRGIPTKLTILEEGIPIKGSVRKKQDFLDDIFHDKTWFQKFRLFDVVAGINILEESSLSLKKTLLSFNENKLNSLRKKLLKKKRDRDVYNIANIDKSPHYPSETRKNVLQKGIESITKLLQPLNKKINKKQQTIRQYNYKLGGLESKINDLKRKTNKINNLVTCPTCHQQVQNNYKDKVAEEVQSLVNKNKKRIKILRKEMGAETNELQEIKNKENDYRVHLNKAQNFLRQLENRLQQKQYKWTPKDLEIIKQCISEVDNFYSFYLLEAIKSIEPLINHILKPIKFKLKFVINNKGKFDFILKHNKKELIYKQLSTGQKLVVSMAVKMALLLDKGESGLIISDEGMSSLSKENLHLMFELIREFPFQLLAVVHRYENPPEFLSLYKVKKGKVKREY